MIGMKDYADEVGYVLQTFFQKNDDGEWINLRADREIQQFKDKSTKASLAGKASAMRRSNERPTTVEQPLNERQLTNNHKPITNNQETNKKTKAVITAPPDGVSVEVWDSFIAIRKAKRAPMTTVALAGIQKEAQKAGIDLEAALAMCCARGWQSFKAAWAIDKQTESERAREQMHKLTRGLATPKENKPFWAKSEPVEAIPNVEPKRLL
jgi:hypothetical protein